MFIKHDFCKSHFGNTTLKSNLGYKSCADTLPGAKQSTSEPGIAGLSWQDVRYRGPNLSALWFGGDTMCVIASIHDHSCYHLWHCNWLHLHPTIMFDHDLDISMLVFCDSQQRSSRMVRVKNRCSFTVLYRLPCVILSPVWNRYLMLRQDQLRLEHLSHLPDTHDMRIGVQHP